jgi:hypothetical protein
LDDGERKLLDHYPVTPWQAVFHRSKSAGDEHVLAVTQAKVEVLYFDDVEYGFNISGVDECGDKR